MSVMTAEERARKCRKIMELNLQRYDDEDDETLWGIQETEIGKEIRAAEDAAKKSMMADAGCGHPTAALWQPSTEDGDWICGWCEDIDAEREECAKVAEGFDSPEGDDIAVGIRARGK